MRPAGNGRLITSLMGNGRQNHKFCSPKNRGGILLYCAGADGNTCGWKSRGDEKQLIDPEWPYSTIVHNNNNIIIDITFDYNAVQHAIFKK